jgi:hypothetical protein
MFEVCERLPGDSGPPEMEREAEEDAGLCGSDLALVPVHLHLELLFKESADAVHHTLTGPLGLH